MKKKSTGGVESCGDEVKASHLEFVCLSRGESPGEIDFFERVHMSSGSCSCHQVDDPEEDYALIEVPDSSVQVIGEVSGISIEHWLLFLTTMLCAVPESIYVLFLVAFGVAVSKFFLKK